MLLNNTLTITLHRSFSLTLHRKFLITLYLYRTLFERHLLYLVVLVSKLLATLLSPLCNRFCMYITPIALTPALAVFGRV